MRWRCNQIFPFSMLEEGKGINVDQQTSNANVLNLDEMLGIKKLIVRFQGGECSIRTVNSLSPDEFARVKEYSTLFTSLTEEQMRLDKDSTMILKAIDDVLEIIAPDLPRYKPTWRERLSRGYKRKFAVSLQQAASIFEFWAANNRPKKAPRAVKPKKTK
jgi:hypothetical protein